MAINIINAQQVSKEELEQVFILNAKTKNETFKENVKIQETFEELLNKLKDTINLLSTEQTQLNERVALFENGNNMLKEDIKKTEKALQDLIVSNNKALEQKIKKEEDLQAKNRADITKLTNQQNQNDQTINKLK